MYLFIGAHPDDIEIGSGGFLIQSIQNGIECCIITFSDCSEQKGNKGIIEEYKQSMDYLGIDDYFLYHLPNTKLPDHNDEIRDILEKIKIKNDIDLVVTHSVHSIHQDHKIVGEECRRVFRYSNLISYEDPKSTSQYFRPQLYISLSEKILKKKLELLNIYRSQLRRDVYGTNIFENIARVRGVEIGTKAAEAYEIIRIKNYFK